MEELTSILGIVVAAGVLLAKALTREKAARAARETGKANPGGEAWPQIPPVTPNRRPAQTNDEAAPEHSVFDPIARKVAARRAEAAERMQEVLRSLAEIQPDMVDLDADGVSAQTQVVSAAPRPTTVPQAVNAPRPAAATAAPRRGNREVLPEAFDLRRAIVYAEILKPKFDE